MNMKLKLVRLVVAATFGSLLWAGCASERTYYVDATADTRPIDLTKRSVDTHPELRIGLDGKQVTDPWFIEEAAGAERR